MTLHLIEISREMLCRYILRPPLANERVHHLEDGMVPLEFKRPWKDGTRSIALKPEALLSRLSAIVPPPRRHITVYSGVLSSRSKWRSLELPGYIEEQPEGPAPQPPPGEPVPLSVLVESRPGEVAVRSRYIPWNELLRRTFGSEIVCPDCGGRLHPIAFVNTEATIRTLLAAMHLQRVFHSPGPPKIAVAERPPGEEEGLEWSGDAGGGRLSGLKVGQPCGDGARYARSRYGEVFGCWAHVLEWRAGTR